MVVHSATLQINELVRERRARGDQVVHLGFGEAGLPVLPALAHTLTDAATENSYAPVAGSVDARESAAGYLTRRGLDTDRDQVLLTPGSKAALYAAVAAVPGDVVLPSPSWVTYAAQAQMTGKHVVWAPIGAGAGGVPDPDRLGDVVAHARRRGADPRVLVLTLPDNPTGTYASASDVERVCETARELDLVIVSDEIYRDLADAPQAVPSPGAVSGDQVIVTYGLSKSLALGGWRIGAARVPATHWGEQITDALVGTASEVWSSLPSPMLAAAELAFDDPDAVTRRVTASRRLHLAVSRAMHRIFVDAGATCREPTAAFYLYPDLSAFGDYFAHHGAHTSADAATLLLERHGIAVLPGSAFGDDPYALRFRVATSLLYGDREQQVAALESDDPAALPWIRESLDAVAEALSRLR